jgi:hypothetical protein
MEGVSDTYVIRSKMKIVYVSFIDLNRKMGGSEHILGLSSALVKIGHEVHLVTPTRLENPRIVSGADRHIRPLLTRFLSSARAGQMLADIWTLYQRAAKG